MAMPKRYIPLITFVSLIGLLFFFHSIGIRDSWRNIPQKVGLGEVVPGASRPPADGDNANTIPPDKFQSKPYSASAAFHPGIPPPHGYNYSRLVVTPRMMEDDISWMKEELPEADFAVYVADDPTAPLHPPKNKGHEVMIYLTYIIDHYDSLADITLFMHSHRWSWHTNDLLGYDAAQTIKRLSAERVTREGYMNLRCHWDPGCPDWMHPGNTEEDINKQEEQLLAESWSEIFPQDPIPKVLAQPCCAQFALSRERIRSIPLNRYVFYRDWVLRTPLSDYISGRIWEYAWQFVFTGHNTYCPSQHACYCDGFGLCFGGEMQYNEYFEQRFRKREWESQLRDWEDLEKAIKAAEGEGRFDDAAAMEQPEAGRDVYLKDQIKALDEDMEKRMQYANERGLHAEYRAQEAGREWKVGDGF